MNAKLYSCSMLQQPYRETRRHSAHSYPTQLPMLVPPNHMNDEVPDTPLSLTMWSQNIRSQVINPSHSTETRSLYLHPQSPRASSSSLENISTIFCPIPSNLSPSPLSLSHPHLTRRQEASCPCLHISHADVISGTDHPTLVQSPIQLHHNLPAPTVVHQLKLADVTWSAWISVEKLRMFST